MKFAVKYKLEREKGMMNITATYSRLIRKNGIKTPMKDDYDFLNWVLIPEFIKQGMVFAPVRNFKEIDKYVYVEVYSFKKNNNDEYSFEIINPDKDDIEEVIVADRLDRFSLSLNYDKYIESGEFTLDKLVKQKIITKEIKRKKKVPLPDLEFED